jgi:hypothetical protein
MRIPGILLALLFGLASIGAAPASDSSQAAPDSAPPRIVLQSPRFPKLPELQPVLPVFAVPDSHSPESLHVPFIQRQGENRK